jgi:YggT family protein
MAAIVNFVFFLLNALLTLAVWALIINAILSWLVAFDVINLRNRFVYQVARFLESVTRPMLAPVQRIVPPLGGVDITPIIVILLITGIQRYLLPAAHLAVLNALG